MQRVNIGLLKSAHYSPALIGGIESADRVFEVVWLGDAEAAQTALRGKEIDGVLASSARESGSVELFVSTKTSLKTLAIVEGMLAW